MGIVVTRETWPALAVALPLREIPKQLAHQSELISFSEKGNKLEFCLGVTYVESWPLRATKELAIALEALFGRPTFIDLRDHDVKLSASISGEYELGKTVGMNEACMSALGSVNAAISFIEEENYLLALSVLRALRVFCEVKTGFDVSQNGAITNGKAA